LLYNTDPRQDRPVICSPEIITIVGHQAGSINEMIISRTPFRISLFGGGTDYPAWFHEHGGAVLGTAINKYSYISVRKLPPFFEHRYRIAYSRLEFVREIGEIKHPVVREVLAELQLDDGLEIHSDSDLPARSGIGSSSAFTVGLLHALSALNGRMVTKSELGREAIRVEQELLNEAVGAQDQLWAAFGGLNHITFSPDGDFEVNPIVLARDRRNELMRSVMMFFTGFSRNASDIAQHQIANMPQRKQQLRGIQAMVRDALEILYDDANFIRSLGEILHESWCLKRELAESVSTPIVDEMYEVARKAGAIGGKLLGAGGGGFMIFLVEPERRQHVRERLANFIHVPVDIDHDGSKIVLYQPDGL
jgi:D-glycero-alpha-D-manno-heptose-7-phosphate kinase